jgi:mevalonate kinase
MDNTVSTYGGFILYNKTKSPKFSSVKPTAHGPPAFEILIIDTGVEKNTKKSVENLRKLHDDPIFGPIVKHVLDAIGKTSQTILELLAKGVEGPESFQVLRQLFKMNHSLLASVQLSHPKLDMIVEYTVDLYFLTEIV